MTTRAATKLARSLRALQVAGASLGLVLGGVLGIVLVRDYRVEAANPADVVLGPFWVTATLVLLLYATYWTGLWFSLRALRRSIATSDKLVEELGASRQELELAQELGRTGSWTARRGRGLDWTAQGARMMGLPAEKTSTTLHEFGAMIHPDDVADVLAQYRKALSTRAPFEHDFRLVPPDGKVRWLAARGAVSPDRSRVAGTVVDITEQQRAQRTFRNLFEYNPLPFWVFDAETLRFLEVNAAAVQQYGYSRAEFLAMTILDIRPSGFHDAVLTEVRETSSPRWLTRRTWTHRRKDGSTLEVKVHTSDIEFQGRPARLILAEDLTETLSYQREVAFRASHDPVSGLPNAQALAEAVASHRDTGCLIAYVQLRGLELIEDSLGLEAGHEVVRAVADRLQRLGERYGLAGHVRGEEFALVVRDLAQWEQALVDLQAELARPVPGRDTLQQLDHWLGSARFPRDSNDPAEAIGRAGLAAHVARTEQAPMAGFTPVMTRRAGKRLDMAARIHRAIDRDEFELHFQLVVCVEDGQATGLEALLRWPQPDGSTVPPAEFIAVSEDTGLIVPLGQWAIHHAAQAQRRLSDAGHGRLSIAVNVSQAQFLRRDLAADFDAALDAFALRRGALHVELTESMLMTRPEAARATLHRLRERGIRISLDDFGTGFSSMSHLRDLPIDALKMDQTFVRDVHCDRRNAAICQALLALGHSMELTVIAEGVEQDAEYAWLSAHRCDQAQGYFLGRPQSLDTVLASL